MSDAAGQQQQSSTGSAMMSTTISVDDDFLSQHLGNLLMRQPRLNNHPTTSSHAQDTSSPQRMSRTLSNNSSASEVGLMRRTSIQSAGSPFSHRKLASIHTARGARGPSGGDDAVERSTTQSSSTAAIDPLMSPTDELFSSFFVNHQTSASDSAAMAEREKSTANRFSSRGVAPSLKSRHGPPSTSMTTSFGARRASSVTSGVDWTVSPNSDGSSVASRSSSSNFSVQQKQPQQCASHPPGMLGQAKVHRMSHDTSATTPPASTEDSSSKSATRSGDSMPESSDWAARHSKHDATDIQRRSSPSASNSTQSLSSDYLSTEEFTAHDTQDSPPLAPTSLSTLNEHAAEEEDRNDKAQTAMSQEERLKRLFDDGGVIEPPEATTTFPNLLELRQEHLTKDATFPSSISFSGRHASIITPRVPVGKRTSLMTLRASEQEEAMSGLHEDLRAFKLDNRRAAYASVRSSGNSDVNSSGGSDERKESFATSGTVRPNFARGAVTAGAKQTTSLDDMPTETPSRAATSGNEALSRRKQSITLIPSGDDGRTFRFVSTT